MKIFLLALMLCLGITATYVYLTGLMSLSGWN